jgi:hypothetical protein
MSNVVDLDHERAAFQQRNANDFLEMESEVDDILQLGRICDRLCEGGLPGDPRVAMLEFAVIELADRIERLHGKYYARPDPEGDEHA